MTLATKSHVIVESQNNTMTALNQRFPIFGVLVSRHRGPFGLLSLS
jgi:hypothetical protein